MTARLTAGTALDGTYRPVCRSRPASQRKRRLNCRDSGFWLARQLKAGDSLDGSAVGCIVETGYDVYHARVPTGLVFGCHAAGHGPKSALEIDARMGRDAGNMAARCAARKPGPACGETPECELPEDRHRTRPCKQWNKKYAAIKKSHRSFISTLVEPVGRRQYKLP